MLVILTQHQQSWESSQGFTASYAGTPTSSIGLQAGFWHHLSFMVSASELSALLVKGTDLYSYQLIWDHFPTQNPLSVGVHATAIGRGSPDWQDGGDFGYGYACMAVDKLRFWSSWRSETNISSNMYARCQGLEDPTAQLAACYAFDHVSSVAGLDVFEDASPNHIPALAAAHGSPYLPWCVNVDDGGNLKLDTEAIESYDWSTTEMWGYCTSKPRLPGAGYAYSEAVMEAANAHRLAGSVTVLERYAGCGDSPLRLNTTQPAVKEAPFTMIVAPT
jgi:hypothetical protein